MFIFVHWVLLTDLTHFMPILPLQCKPCDWLLSDAGPNQMFNADVHHFANDTNVLYSSKSLKDINKKINFDLKNIVMWLKANKILLNADKIELVLFRSNLTEKLLKA